MLALPATAATADAPVLGDTRVAPFWRLDTSDSTLTWEVQEEELLGEAELETPVPGLFGVIADMFSPSHLSPLLTETATPRVGAKADELLWRCSVAAKLPRALTVEQSGAGKQTSHDLHPAHVIVITGHPGSGKTALAKALHDACPDWAWASCGDFVRSEALRQGVPLDFSKTDHLGQRLVEELGGQGFLDAVLRHADVPENAEKLIIDDVYHVEVFEAMAARWPHVRSIEVNAPLAVQREGTGSEAIASTVTTDRHELDAEASRLEQRVPPSAVFAGISRDDQRELHARVKEVSDYIGKAA
jgi:hypothetical protein